MARLWFVLVLVLAQIMFVISEENHKQSCDLCISEGGIWCHSGKKHCIKTDLDNVICPVKDVEQLDQIITNKDGDLLQPMYAERTLSLRDPKAQKMTLTYASSTLRNVTTHFRNQEVTFDPKINIEIKDSMCDARTCTVDIFAKPEYDFCSFHESVEIIIKIDGFTDEATVKYHVPCSCKCTNDTEKSSGHCNNHGDFTCGICTCEPDWTGDKCEKSCRRGDIDEYIEECMNTNHNDDMPLECSGNGKCVCRECKCFDDREGSQYFDPTEKCSDICMQTVDCHSCLRNGSLGDCHCGQKHMELVPMNMTLATTQMENFYGKTRKLWVHCHEIIENCDYDYYAMMAEGDRYSVMINSNCNNHTAGSVVVATSGTNVPLIIGIVGIIAAIATVGGILLWKHMNALPPLPMTDPQYANIDAEDCTGENPLYKPPTSSFKNPTYGKW